MRNLFRNSVFMGTPKVLYITYNAASDPVAQSQVIPYVEELAECGVDVSLVTYEKKVDEKIRQFNKALKERLTRSGIIWYRLPYHKRPSLPATIYDILHGIIFVYFLLLKHKFNILHARQVMPATICMILRKIIKFKWIFDMRGLFAEEHIGHGNWREGGVKFRSVKLMEKLCLLNADSIILLTHRQKDFISKLPFLRNKNKPVEVIPCCVDLKKFSLAVEKNQNLVDELGLQRKFVLIYLGSLGTCYLLSEMIDYFLYLGEKINNAFFLFITHSDKELIVSKANEKGLRSDSFKVIASPFEQVPALLSCGDAGIYFINSYRKLGSSPIKTGEYLACGLPLIINSGIGDSENIVKNHKIGTMIHNFSAEDYQRSLNELLELLNEREALRSRCREVATKYLSLSSAIQKYKHIYERLNEDTFYKSYSR